MQVSTKSQDYYDILDFSLESKKSWSYMHQYLNIHYAVTGKASVLR